MAMQFEKLPSRRSWFVLGLIVPALTILILTSGLFQWSRLNCRYEDVDINTGRIRYTRYLLFCPLGSRIEETWLSRASQESSDSPDWHRVNTFSRLVSGILHTISSTARCSKLTNLST